MEEWENRDTMRYHGKSGKTENDLRFQPKLEPMIGRLSPSWYHTRRPVAALRQKIVAYVDWCRTKLNNVAAYHLKKYSFKCNRHEMTYDFYCWLAISESRSQLCYNSTPAGQKSNWSLRCWQRKIASHQFPHPLQSKHPESKRIRLDQLRLTWEIDLFRATWKLSFPTSILSLANAKTGRMSPVPRVTCRHRFCKNRKKKTVKKNPKAWKPDPLWSKGKCPSTRNPKQNGLTYMTFDISYIYILKNDEMNIQMNIQNSNY